MYLSLLQYKKPLI